jgi:glycosyltransferase involved in cell wall biosynthesis
VTATRGGPATRISFYTDAVGFGGAETVMGHLVAGLDRRFTLEVLGVNREVVERVASRRPGTRTALASPVRHKLDLSAIASHVRAVHTSRPAILHAHLRTPWSCQYGLLAGVVTPGVRTIATEHLPLASAVGLQRRLKRALVTHLDAHVAVGEVAARLVEQQAGLRQGAVRVIPNGIPIATAVPRPRVAPGPIVGSLGRLDRQKGYDVLVRALPLLPGVTAVLVGDGAERPELERLAGKLGVSDRLRITGWLEDGRALLPSFDVFVLPSLYEGLPLVVLEAMLAGLPVVASDVGSVRDAVSEGVTGLLVPAGDVPRLAAAVQRALDPEFGPRLGQAGRARALERFTVESMVRAYEMLYDDVLR